MDLKQQILSANDTVGRQVEVPEWNVTVRIKQMSLAESMDFQAQMQDIPEGDNASSLRNMATFLSKCLCDDAGNRIFSDDEVHLLDTRSLEVIKRLVNIASEVNGIGDEVDGEEAKKS